MVDFAKHWASDSAVDSFSKAEWVVDRLIAKGSINWIYGAPGCFKSFAALDIACSIGAGKAWLANDVVKGPVFYFAGEGGTDLHLRRVAWEKANKARAAVNIISAVAPLDSEDSSGFNFLKHTIVGSLESAIKADKDSRLRAIWDDMTMSIPERGKIADEIELEKKPDLPSPALIVIDTFATSARDDSKESVSRFFSSIRRLIREYPNVAVLVVDHTTKGGDSYMGSHAKLGNSDWFVEAVREGDVLTLKSEKHKLRDLPEQIALAVRYQSVGVLDSKGRELGSLVCIDGTRQKRFAELVGGDTHAGYLLGQLSANNGPMARAELLEGFSTSRCDGLKPESSKRAFRRAVAELDEHGLIEIDDDESITII